MRLLTYRPAMTIAIVLIAGVVGLWPSHAAAQQRDRKLGERWPSIYVHVCPTIETAVQQRNRATDLAAAPSEDLHLKDLFAAGCFAGPALVTPRYKELSIPAGRGWNAVFDPASSEKCEHWLQISPGVQISPRHLARIVKIPCTWIAQETEFYFVDFLTLDGKAYSGYAEVFSTFITHQYIEHLRQTGGWPWGFSKDRSFRALTRFLAGEVEYSWMPRPSPRLSG